MSSFLTEGRLALVAALQADADLAAQVRTWFTFGPGLRDRRELSAASCPAVSVSPVGTVQRPVANVEREVVQRLRVEVGVAGQDLAPCEDVLDAVLSCVEDCNSTCLGLSDDGLTAVRASSVTWAPEPRQGAARLIWSAAVNVELIWRRR